MKLRRRLLSAVLAFTALTLGGAFFAVYEANNRVQERQLDEALVREALEEAREVAAAGGDELVISTRPGPHANDVGPLTKYAVVFDSDGRVLASTESFGGHVPELDDLPVVPSGTPFDTWFHREHLRGVVVSVPSGESHRLWLAAPRTDLDGDAAFLARAMVLVFFVALAWSLLLVWFIVRRFVRNHEHVARVMHRVVEGDLSARVPPDTRDDELGNLARDVNQLLERLVSLLASQRLFVAYAAHELRSPLTSLYGELLHALRRPRDAESYRAAIVEALESAERLKQLSEDLLTFARTSEALDAPREPVPLAQTVEQALRWLSAQQTERGVEVKLSGQFGTAFARSADLERLFRNLLENAIMYAPTGSTIEVRGELGVECIVTVANDGTALPDVEMEHLFEPFVRGPEVASKGLDGTGLGLSIARQLARAHGGSVELVRGLARGVEARVRLPRQVA